MKRYLTTTKETVKKAKLENNYTGTLFLSIISLVKNQTIALPIGWRVLKDQSVLAFHHQPNENHKITTDKVAAFDFDGCLWKQSFSHTFKYPNGLMFSCIQEKFDNLFKDGFRIIILSNENLAYMKENPIRIEKACKLRLYY